MLLWRITRAAPGLRRSTRPWLGPLGVLWEKIRWGGKQVVCGSVVFWSCFGRVVLPLNPGSLSGEIVLTGPRYCYGPGSGVPTKCSRPALGACVHNPGERIAGGWR